jgi:hypothetical protein
MIFISDAYYPSSNISHKSTRVGLSRNYYNFSLNAFIVLNYPLLHWQKTERSLRAILYANIAAASSIALTNLGYIWSRYIQVAIHIIKYEYTATFPIAKLYIHFINWMNSLIRCIRYQVYCQVA